MSFIEERLLDKVTYGSEFGHSYHTTIHELRNGFDRRNADWAFPLHKGAVVYNNLKDADHALVIAAHHACLGAWAGFRFKDWSDYIVTDENFGTGTGAEEELQLTKTYAFGSTTLARHITKPVTVQVYVDGTPVTPTIDMTTGLVTITATASAAITWTGEFDVPVRFGDDEIMFEVDAQNANTLFLTADVPIMETRTV